MRVLLRDVRHGLRTLARSPGFSLIAVAVLALGIGLNTTVFSLANALFLRPLPVSDPGTVVRVYSNRFSNTLYGRYTELRDRASTLEGLAAYRPQSFGMRVDGEVEHEFGDLVTGNYFPVLGVIAARGRLLAPADDSPSAPPVVVLSHAFWVRRFGSSPDIIGRTIGLNGHPFTIVGVAARDFTGVLAPLASELWAPVATDAVLRPSVDSSRRLEALTFHLIGRLKAGISREQAQADLDTIGRQARAAEGEPDRPQPAVSVYGSTMLHPEASRLATTFTAVLMAVVGLLLLIVCVNLANLVLSRAAGREVELAVRQSLGAGRFRLLRQLLTENLLLSAAGAAGGLGIAYAAGRFVMSARLPVPLPVLLDLSIDTRVLAFTVLVSAGATLAFGAAPALTASRLDLVRSLKGAGGTMPRHRRLRSIFLVTQVAMSMLLLVAAGLFVRSVRNADALDTGFNATNVVVAAVDLDTRGYSAARGGEFARLVAQRLDSAAAIASANIVDIVPMTLSNQTAALLRDEDAEPAAGQPFPTPRIYTNAVGPGHFRTLEIPLLAGRDFTHADGSETSQVGIVNETLARRFWPGKDAVGQRLRPAGVDGATRAIEIVGVVRDSKYVTVGEEAIPFLYRPLAQDYTPSMAILARARGDMASAVAAINETVHSVDSGLAVFHVSTLANATSVSLLPARVAGWLLGVLGLIALALAALGTYGVLSFLVQSRTREIGVRMAVGATRGAVLMLVVRQALGWTAVGGCIGLALALVLTRFLVSLLYGISPVDPLTFAGVTLLLAAVAGVAALVPAVRASRMDPLTALRHR